MVHLIDTSVWISVHRAHRPILAGRVTDLLREDEAAVCGLIWVEFLGGFRNTERRQRVAGRMRDLVWMEMSRQTFKLAGELAATCKGIGMGDAIIAATALAADVPLLTLDAGFRSVEAVGLKLLLVRAE